MRETKKIQKDLLRDSVNVHDYLQNYYKKNLVDFKMQQLDNNGNQF